jgi:hypothetical protein
MRQYRRPQLFFLTIPKISNFVTLSVFRGEVSECCHSDFDNSIVNLLQSFQIFDIVSSQTKSSDNI